MRWVACTSVVAAALVFSSCQSIAIDGEHRTVVAVKFSSQATKIDIANRIEKAVLTCWVSKDPAFAGLKFKPLEAYSDAREKALQLSLKDPKNSERYANINIFPASRENDTGYVVQIVQKGEGVEVASTLRRSIRDIEWGQSPCPKNAN